MTGLTTMSLRKSAGCFSGAGGSPFHTSNSMQEAPQPELSAVIFELDVTAHGRGLERDARLALVIALHGLDRLAHSVVESETYRLKSVA